MTNDEFEHVAMPTVEDLYKKLVSRGHAYEKCLLLYCEYWDNFPLCDHSPEVRMGTCGCFVKRSKRKK